MDQFNQHHNPHHQAPAPTPGQPLPPTPADPRQFTNPAPVDDPANEHPEKSYLITVFLSYLFGSFGFDRVYLGKTGTGILKLVTLGGFGIWSFIDIILATFGYAQVKDDTRKLKGFAANRAWVKICFIMMVAFYVVYFAVMAVILIVVTAHGINDRVKNTNSNDLNSQYERQLRDLQQNYQSDPSGNTDYQFQ